MRRKPFGKSNGHFAIVRDFIFRNVNLESQPRSSLGKVVQMRHDEANRVARRSAEFVPVHTPFLLLVISPRKRIGTPGQPQSLRGSERQSLAGAIRNWRAACHFVSRSVLCFQSARWHAPPRSWSKQYNDMAPSHFSSRRGRWIALITAGLGTAHFAISVFLWALLAGKGLLGRPDWPRICTAIVLLGASITAFSLAWKRLRVSQVLILGALLLATGSFWHDVSHHRYQLRGWLAEGEYTYDYTYLTWWWYEERRAGWSDLQQHPYQVRTWSILGLAGHTWRHYEEHPSKTK